MNIPDEVIYGALGALYLTHSAFQKRQFTKLEKSAKECEVDRKVLRDKQELHLIRTGKLEAVFNLLATPCKTPGCERNDIIDEATSLQNVTPAQPVRRVDM